VKTARLGFIRVLIPMLLVVLGVVACSPAPAPATSTPSGPPQQITVKSLDTMAFDPTTLSAKAGQPIQLTLDNSSAKLQHDFDITDGVAQPVKLTAQPGQTANVTFTLDKPGSYTFFCAQPGHEGAGMKGTITVQ
jgi:uncharacterized cupredoxin-like copper-binding protein